MAKSGKSVQPQNLGGGFYRINTTKRNATTGRFITKGQAAKSADAIKLLPGPKSKDNS